MLVCITLVQQPRLPSARRRALHISLEGGTFADSRSPWVAPSPTQFLDLDNSWLDRLDTGFDFSDIFNTAGDVPASADGE